MPDVTSIHDELTRPVALTFTVYIEGCDVGAVKRSLREWWEGHEIGMAVPAAPFATAAAPIPNGQALPIWGTIVPETGTAHD